MRWYIQHFPIARGKGPMLALLRRCLPAGLFPAPLHDNMWLLLRRDDMVAFLTFVRQVWEPENTTIVRSLLQAGDAFVDVGANAGYFTVLAGLLVGPSGEVLALEPMPETHEWLGQNVRLNDLDNVTLLAAAAADHEDGLELQFFAGETQANASQFAVGREAVRTVRVPTIRLDSLLSRLSPERPLMLKVDIEGGEYSALVGGLVLLQERRPILMFELFPALGQAAGWTPAEMLGLLERTGRYRFYISTGRCLRPLLADDIPTVDSGDHIDVFAFSDEVGWHDERRRKVTTPDA
jgi:FkbM family methyltransferase